MNVTYLNIKSWAEEDRPREKLLLKGKSSLTESELIAILIGSGTPSVSAVDLSKSILTEVNNDLHQLAKLSVKDLVKFKGIGEAKAVSIVAAMELGRRKKESEASKKVKITCSLEAYKELQPHFLDLRHEEFWALYLSRSNTVLKKQLISSGGVSGTIADPKIIFKSALDELASAVILAHNHPSENLRPSEADKKLTKKMKEAGLLLEIPVHDHLIVGNESYFSFADENMM